MKKLQVAQSSSLIVIALSAMVVCVSAPIGVSARAATQSASSQASSPQAGAPQQSATKPSAEGPSAASDDKTKKAGEAYKNIQVLKDIREDQLIPSMRYMTAALGVRCDFCHVQDEFPSDDKPEKGRAREMMKMMMAINTDNFHGRREVTCFTCHAGHSHPTSIPAIPDSSSVAAGAPANAQGSPANAPASGADGPGGGNAASSAAPLPSVDEILVNYTKALGGADAIQKMTSRTEKGTVDIPAHNVHSTMDVIRKAPDKALATLHSQMGEVVEGFDGTVGWESRGRRGVEEETGDQLVRVHEWAAFIPGLDLKANYSRA